MLAMYFSKFVSVFLCCIVVFGTNNMQFYVNGLEDSNSTIPSATQHESADNTNNTNINITDTPTSTTTTPQTTILEESEHNCSSFSDLQECCNTTHNCSFCFYDDASINGTCFNRGECKTSNIDKCFVPTPLFNCLNLTSQVGCCNSADNLNCSWCHSSSGTVDTCRSSCENQENDMCSGDIVPTGATTAATTASNSGGQQFDSASFIGGIVFCGGLVALVFFGLKFYKARKEQNYHTL